MERGTSSVEGVPFDKKHGVIPNREGQVLAKDSNQRVPGIYALDSGCVWGNRLTAIRLDAPDVPAFSVPAMPMPLP